ncbi:MULTISPECIES: MAB_1171c family putative transporter [Streptomyces]|uniref:MAB_1171c family putative transporter n=1 Tax=Streptomyces TaxID=1883 RepID=UPI002683DD77
MSAQALVAGALWIVSLWRLPSVRHSHRQRSLWAAFTFLAIALTFEPRPVAESIDSTMGVTGLAHLLKYLFGIISAAAVLDFVANMARPEGFAPRLRWAAVITALPLMVLFFALTPGPQAEDFFESVRPSLFAAAYKSVFTLYIGCAMTMASWLFLSGVRHSHGWTRGGRCFLGGGTAIGAAYALHRLLSLALLASGHALPGGESLADGLSEGLKLTAIASIVLGSCLPPIAVATEAVYNWRTYRRLESLWEELTTAAPDVVLPTQAPWHKIKFRLERRVVEIGDACLALREVVPASVQAKARTAAAQADIPEADRAAAAEAGWLATAVRTNHVPATQCPDDRPVPGVVDTSPEEEVAWLLHVSDLYRTPLVTEFAAAEAAALSRHSTEQGTSP